MRRMIPSSYMPAYVDLGHVDIVYIQVEYAGNKYDDVLKNKNYAPRTIYIIDDVAMQGNIEIIFSTGLSYIPDGIDFESESHKTLKIRFKRGIPDPVDPQYQTDIAEMQVENLLNSELTEFWNKFSPLTDIQYIEGKKGYFKLQAGYEEGIPILEALGGELNAIKNESNDLIVPTSPRDIELDQW